MTTSTADIIRDQIGNKALYMLGAKNLMNVGNGLSLRIRGSRKVNYIKITLNGMDTYDMEFGKVHGLNYKVVATHEGIYVDMMHKLIENETGLYTSL
jgi:hypothetical protein